LVKQSRLPFNPSVISSTKPFAMIHCDIWGPYRHPCLSGAHYFLIIVDDFTRFTWIFLMKHKNEAQSLLKFFFNYVLIQFKVHIKILRSGNGGEFLSLRPFLQEKGALFSTFLCLHASTKWGYGTQASSYLTSSSRFEISCSTPTLILG